MAKNRPKTVYLNAAIVLVVAMTLGLRQLGLATSYAYLIAVNAAAFLLYGLDKQQAITGSGRVPEWILLLAGLAGGTPAALAGQLLFRHKTRKRHFQVIFVGIVLFQAAVIYGYWLFVLRRP